MTDDKRILIVTLMGIPLLFLFSCFSRHMVKNENLRKELLQMVVEDQKSIKEAMKNDLSKAKQNIGNRINKESNDPFQTNIQVQLNNTKRMKDIIKTFGWPSFDLVGKNGSDAAWLIVQHGDLELQEMSIDLLKNAVDRNQAGKWCYAYLLDRILIRKGEKQIYGTQLDLKNGQMIPFPIEDETNVDKRRKAMGMKPLQEYIGHFPKGFVKEPLKKIDALHDRQRPI